jgi:hypothetical protein
MDTTHAEIAARIRRRAFRSRNPRAARKLLALADEVPSMHLPHAGRVLVLMGPPEKRPGDLPGLRAIRRRKRWLDMARPLNRHPLILARLGELIPRAKGRPGARLREDLHMDDAEIAALAAAIEDAWHVPIDRRAADEWETLNDVTDTIAAAQDVAA